MATNLNERECELKVKRICRFCLSQMSEKLSSIYSRDAVHLKSKVPLSVQIMACVSIEVFSNDGMPPWICIDCRALFAHGYRFKQMCKHAETQLRQFPLTGQWPKALAKPGIPLQNTPLSTTPLEAQTSIPTGTSMQVQAPKTKTLPTLAEVPQLKQLPMLIQPQQQNVTGPKKILNSNPVDSPEPPVPVRFKKEKLDEETAIFLTKVENDEELSMDDVQRLIAATNSHDEDVMLAALMPSPKKKPKVLNKSSIRILNKEAEVVLEPRLSKPQVKRDEAGNVAIVTEILDPNDPYETEPDPIKNATPVETNVFPCPHCERSFPLRQLREIHMVNHNRERSFQCGECVKSFFSKYDLQKHNLIHTGDKPFKCTICPKAFTRATLLHRHEKTHTDIAKFICIYCEKSFISEVEMEQHVERHRKNRPFQCKVCNKSFAFKQGLERHESIHSRDQPYPCQYCDQSFSTPSKLARHLTAHAGKRPYPCKFCPKSYLLSHHLTRHLRSHKQGTALFMCTDCTKVYTKRDDLIFHSAKHAIETLCCPLCKDVLEDIDMVTEHFKAHAEGEAYACEFCDLIFMSAERLQEHTDGNHADDLFAYHEDDKTQAKNGKKMDTIQNEETIKELLIEELPPGRVLLTEDGIIKLESTEKANQTQATVDICMDSTGVVEEIGSSEPATKIRKTATNATVGVATEEKTEIEKKASPLLRRKIGAGAVKQPEIIVTATETDTETSPKTKIQIKEHKIIASANTSSINNVLKTLPKSVSVRKRSPAGAAKTASPASTVRSSPVALSSKKVMVTKTEQIAHKRILRTSTRRSDVAPAAVSGHSGTTQPLNNNQATKRSTETDTIAIKNDIRSIVSTQAGTSREKVVKMMIGDKKVKVHKITISRSEADAMAKDGRIRIKDGNMILTQAQTLKSSS